jgi:hypothetical protein
MSQERGDTVRGCDADADDQPLRQFVAEFQPDNSHKKSLWNARRERFWNAIARIMMPI